MANQNLQAELSRYRAERANEPQFYYNELADRVRSLAEIRPLLENFLAGQLGLKAFVRGVAGESRRESTAARGRTASRYWRFNSAGRLFLDSFVKQAEVQSRLNSAGQLLQACLTPPATLNEASQKIENLLTFGKELEIAGGQTEYVASFFWAMQQPQWPVFEPAVRQYLANAGFGQVRSDYNSFYIGFNRLAGELQIPNAWELESFLHWLTQRATATVRLLPVKPRRERSAKQTRRHAEELRRLLEPLLHAVLGSTFVGKPAPDGGLNFTLAEEPFRLELRPAASGWLVGVGFEGFSPAALATLAGEKLLIELKGFLQTRATAGYQFYAGNLANSTEPDQTKLADEFWLLRSLPTERPAARTNLGEEIISEWKLLYPFACRLLGLLEEDISSSEIEPTEVPSSTDFSYETEPAEANLRQVAETGLSYQTSPTEEVVPVPPVISNEAANQEVRQIAQIKPAALTADQLEALLAYVKERLVIQPEKITEIVTHLEAGRSLLLYGPPGSGKTRLARLIAGQLCAPDPGWSGESEATNYTLATATAEWSQYDTIGGIRPGLAGEGQEASTIFYYFEPGVVSRAALACEESLRRTARPHYLIIDEFNRANQERAFGELFTLLEYRDRPLLAGNRLGRTADLFIPAAFRIIGTLNAEDRNTVFDIGQALRRRFAMVEIGLPPPAEERKFLPKAVKTRLPSLVLTTDGDFADPVLAATADKLTDFVNAIRPTPTGGGREIGTAPVIESMLFCAVAASYYEQAAEALEDAILANILPQLEGAPSSIKRALAVVPPEMPRVKATLQRMSGYL